MKQRLLLRLREHLRRDPRDGDVAFLITLAVREPSVVYPSELQRLRGLLRRGATTREQAIADAAEYLLGGLSS